jgi:polyhydroxyalkanoate synthase
MPNVNDNELVKFLVKNPEAFAQNLADVMQQAGKAMSNYAKPREDDTSRNTLADELTIVARTLAKVGEYWTADPARAAEAQSRLMSGYMSLWNRTLQRMAGEAAAPVAEPDARDKRFQDPEWRDNQFFDFLKQLYLITSRWADDMVDEADLDAATRLKAEFYVRQLAGALSPSNFVLTNPEVLRQTFKESAGNIARGMKMMAEDIEAGKGDLKLRQSDTKAFEVGVNLATTPGKVIHQNEVCQLIQYAPTTERVLKRPLLIVPPWINKYYILDLTSEKSFVKWCVDQGHTVFLISWVNPEGEHADKSFEQYMREGILETLDVIEKVTGEDEVNAVAYCVGGTLLAVTLAYCAAVGDERIKSATLFTTQVDFQNAGDLRVYVDEEQIRILEQMMKGKGYLEGSKMAMAFNMLKPNDLIWPFFIKNYLKGDEPQPFDLLYWNADSTRMPAANHSFYLRNCYLENNLSKGKMKIGGRKLDLSKVKIPIYNLATKEDHIAPPLSVFNGSSFFGGPVTYVLGGSGHIAGVVNPPDKNKYQFWTGGPPTGSFETWVEKAKENKGSWWPHWHQWIKDQSPDTAKARVPGGRKLNPIEDAPGSYVRIKA